MSQDSVEMKYDPADGGMAPSPNIASHWRTFNGDTAWMYNPWTGELRDARDVGSDPQGMLINP